MILDSGHEDVVESVESSGDGEIDSKPVETTLNLKEAEKDSRTHGQEGRPIDDCKASFVNFAVTQNEGVTIHTIDRGQVGCKVLGFV